MSTWGLIIVAAFIALGLVCILVPILPGGLTVFLSIAAWAAIVHTHKSWIVLGIAIVLYLAAEVIKYLWPMKRMKAADISNWTLVIGAICGFIGFFVVPVIGMAIGFVLGVFVAEYVQLRDGPRAWASTKHAIKGVALLMGVEFTAALIASVVWLVAVLT